METSSGQENVCSLISGLHCGYIDSGVFDRIGAHSILRIRFPGTTPISWDDGNSKDGSFLIHATLLPLVASYCREKADPHL